MKHRIAGELAVVILVCVATISVAASAAFSGEQVFNKDIMTSGVDVRIEQFVETKDGMVKAKAGIPVLPGERASYIPRVTNLKTESFVRVKSEIADSSGKYETVTPEFLTKSATDG